MGPPGRRVRAGRPVPPPAGPEGPIREELSVSAVDCIKIPHTDEAWRAYVESSPQALPFHHPSWIELGRECYGHRPFVLALRGPDGELLGGLPVAEAKSLSQRTRWVALPYTDRCPPLVRDGLSPTLVADRLDRARRESGMASLEVRSELGSPRQEATVALLHRLTLDPDPERLLSSLRGSHAGRNARRAMRDGVEVWRASERSDLVQTYYRFHTQTHHRHGAPVQPRRFFELLWDRVLEPGHGMLLLAGRGGVPMAGAVFLFSKRTVVYKYGGSDPEHLRLRPNFALFWEAIRWSCEAGYETLDFGRTDFDNEGLRRFKVGWGATETPLRYTLLADRIREDWPSNPRQLASRVLGRSPAFVARAVGALLYRYAVTATSSAPDPAETRPQGRSSSARDTT